MRKILLFILLIPLFAISQNSKDSILIQQNQLKIEELNKDFNGLQKKYEYQIKINDQTINSISNQIGATSFNLSIFAFLFGILAIGLGVYVTWVERKIIRIREENESLLKQTKQTKSEVVAINELIQKDIYGLFLKIKREETEHILKRLTNVPKDICNVSSELLSRELLEDDFEILKKAYLKLDDQVNDDQGNYKGDYKIVLFQHFLDLVVKDNELGPEIIEYYPIAIRCSFENDIVKSTEDFMKAIIDLGFQKRDKEINSFIKGLSSSQHKDYPKVYEIIFNSLNKRDNQFKFYSLIESEKENRNGKVNFGKLLIEKYCETELSDSEKAVNEDIKLIKKELEKEEAERIVAEEKRKKAEIERKKKIEERKKAQVNKK
tara:strand:- start:140 stop:1273 length:1134 start_codon:yes stop_codon:yes gene_type:complete